jgi:arylformamidase
MPRILDISQPLEATIAVWPGDTPFQVSWTARLDRSDPANVGSVTMSLHTGTHADAPRHVRNSGASIDTILEPFIGLALVTDTSGGAITTSVLQNLPKSPPPRVLFKTGGTGYLDAGAARDLVSRKVRLVGLDSPSIDTEDSTTLETHHILADAGVVILENLDLSAVSPGQYELVALPLRLVGMDASPVRAILRTLEP